MEQHINQTSQKLGTILTVLRFGSIFDSFATRLCVKISTRSRCFGFNDGELLRFMMTHSLVKNSGGKGDRPFFHIPRKSPFVCGISKIFNVDFEFLQGMDFNEIFDIDQLQKVVFFCLTSSGKWPQPI